MRYANGAVDGPYPTMLPQTHLRIVHEAGLLSEADRRRIAEQLYTPEGRPNPGGFLEVPPGMELVHVGEQTYQLRKR